MKNLTIIGGGPAGISAALYAKMAGAEVTVITTAFSALKKAELIKNYYGFKGGIKGSTLFQRGINQAAELGVQIIKEEVVSLEFTDKFNVVTDKGSYNTDSVIIAAGKVRNRPKIKNFDKFEGAGISYCATCDGFFYKNKKIGLIGSSEFAFHEYEYLKNITKDITVFTDGEKPSAKFDGAITEKIESLNGDKRLEGLTLQSGKAIPLDGLFVAIGTADSTALATKIGILQENGNIAVDENMSTNVPGIFACGDCTGGKAQIAKCVYDGLKAGLAAAAFLKK